MIISYSMLILERQLRTQLELTFFTRRGVNIVVCWYCYHQIRLSFL